MNVRLAFPKQDIVSVVPGPPQEKHQFTFVSLLPLLSKTIILVVL